MRTTLCISVLFFSAILFTWTGCGGQHGENGAMESASNVEPTFDGEPVSIALINQSAEPIRRISIAPTDAYMNETNLLESEFLAVGQRVDISGLPPGTWDIAVEDRMGRSRTYRAQRLEADEAYSLIVDAYGWQ